MKYLAEKVKDGVIDLSKTETPLLIKWLDEAETHEERDLIGHELCYRSEEMQKEGKRND